MARHCNYKENLQDSGMIYLFAVMGYLLGSVPFGLVLSYLFGYGDIRKIGSGNIGATNVLRTGNKKLALAVLILDGAKGAAAVALARYFGDHTLALTAGFFSIIGHIFPVWLKFRGGKGVATTLGMYLVLAPWVGLSAILTWLAAAALFRYSSLAALMAMLAAPIAAHFIYDDAALAAICGFIGTVVWLRHRTNIKRLIAGEEPKIGKKKKNETGAAAA
jgi:glycerol-3-phosphate acyltransferase PlsY